MERGESVFSGRRMTVYFGCSMLGGYANVRREDLAAFPKTIVEMGHSLASDHQTQPGMIEKESKLDPTYIHDRDYGWVLESDVGVFEISNPSLGVGGEISDMIGMGKPVLMLFRKGLEGKVSAYIRGKCGSGFVKSRIDCKTYEDMKDARAKMKLFIDSCRQEGSPP